MMQYDAPEVSCILPVYNGEGYIAEAVQSVLIQTYENFELIIIDDGSRDGSPAILRSFAEKDPRVKIITKENGGIVSALNAGLEAARGKYIARMDADDIMFPNRLELQRNFLEAHPEVVMVGGLLHSIDEHGRGIQEPDNHNVGKDPVFMPHNLLIYPPKAPRPLHPLIMLRKKALQEIGGYRDAYRHVEDYDMYLRICKCGKVADIQEMLLYYRIHGDNISVRNLLEQEQNAARADLAAVKKERMASGAQPLKISPRSFQGYVDLRVFRRNVSYGKFRPQHALSALVNILGGAIQTERPVSIRLFLMLGVNVLRSRKVIFR